MESLLGTAGKPILTILEKNNFINILVVVTRYFGGILLGTGGLVKAYSDATILAIKKAECMNIEQGYDVSIDINYQEFEKVKYFCNLNNIEIKKELFTENVNLVLEVSKSKIEYLNQFINKSSPNSRINILSEIYIKFKTNNFN